MTKAILAFANPKAWEKESEMFDDPTPENVAQALLPFIKTFICSHTWHQKTHGDVSIGDNT